MDKRWRKKTIAVIGDSSPKKVLDIATGTGDLAIAASKLNPDKIIGIDLAEKMLVIAQQKAQKKGLSDIITFQIGDAESIPFPDNSFDAVTIAFGIRNFSNLAKGFEEIHRVLKQEGKVAILETSRPQKFPSKQLYTFYFKRVLPFMGRIVAKNRDAYQYFSDTVMEFPQGDELLKQFYSAGFSSSFYKTLSLGSVTIYAAIK